MRKGWFKIPGVQDGDRSVDEQLKGLHHLLAEVQGKRVLDLGSAEGMISRAVLAHGAAFVHGVEVVVEHVEEAARQLADVPPSRWLIQHADLNKPLEPVFPPYDIVLALAIFHKLKDPAAGVRSAAALTGSLMVIRLPLGSQGEFASKYQPNNGCNVNKILPADGFTLERLEKGPRKELVQYWRRRA